MLLRQGSSHYLHELHGFCDASEQAYTAVIYLCMMDLDGGIQVSFVTSKTKVAPIKRLTIPYLELCGVYLLAQLLLHVQQFFNLLLIQKYAWTDRTIVLSWLIGNHRQLTHHQLSLLHSGVDSTRSLEPCLWNRQPG